ncbi:MAG: DUF21 domain-containing protein, partial [Candidatus Aminicenantes bacterium]|nr:DUF21 domain-containing protein [Candidatus Aminicenantes bacterium]
MEIEASMWVGFGLSLFAAFFYSLFHISLSSSSKISLSRILEDREKQVRSKILDIYEELKVSTEILRIFFLIAFLAFLFMAVPQWRIWSLWFFLGLVVFYILILELIPRLLNSRFNQQLLLFFLASFRLPYLLTKPILWILKSRGDEEEPEEQREASEEELDAFVEEAAEEGIIEEEEGELLKSVVEFGDTIVRE